MLPISQVAREVLAARKAHNEQILVGVNCRDLDKLTVDLPRLHELAEHLPPGFAHVAESGVASLEDVRTVVDIGYHVALVGTTLMNSADPRKLLGEMLAAGRERAMAVRTRKMRIATGRRAMDDAVSAWRSLDQDLRSDDARGGQAAVDAGADAIGFVFAPSKRQVTRAARRGAARRRAAPDYPRGGHAASGAGLVDEVWSVFRPDVLQTDIEDLATLRMPDGAAGDAGRAGQAAATAASSAGARFCSKAR